MKNYERYKEITGKGCDRKSLLYYLGRIPSDKQIVPLLKKIKNQSVLDVGIGTGYYTKYLIDNNRVMGIDQNPHLCRLPVNVIKGDATEIDKLVSNEKFDIVLSTWMTEYLDIDELSMFVRASKKVLKTGGSLTFTVLENRGLGGIYVALAKRIRNITKHSYNIDSVKQIVASAGLKDISTIKLSSWFGIPFAYLVQSYNYD